MFQLLCRVRLARQLPISQGVLTGNLGRYDRVYTTSHVDHRVENVFTTK